jgi:hypothetical protein
MGGCDRRFRHLTDTPSPDKSKELSTASRQRPHSAAGESDKR